MRPVIEFDIPIDLKAKGIKSIFYDGQRICLYHMGRLDAKHSERIICKVNKKSLQVTIEAFQNKVDGKMDTQTKLECIYCISQNWRKYISLDEGIESEKTDLTDEQQEWYHTRFPNDPSNQNKSNNIGDEDDCNVAKNPNKAQLVLDTAKASYNKLFVDEYQIPHAAIFINGHLEVVPLKSKRFRNWIAGIVYRESGMVVDSQTIKDILGVLNAEAEFNDEEAIKLDLRVAARTVNGKTAWYIDLTNKDWEFIEITSDGWRIVNNQIIFRRFNNQSPQVYPSREYPPDILDRFTKLVLDVNVREEYKQDYWLLLKCYVICALIPDISKPVLMPNGHQGGAKTSLMEYVKTLIDPSIIKTLSFPHDVNQLIQQLSHNFVAYYDNVSKLSDWISDEICRVVTGSGSSKRVLYSDDDDFIYNFRRCVGLNGINLAATKPDILDRGLNFRVKRIADQDRRLEKEVKKEFEAMRPQLLGCILDILVKILRWQEELGGLNLKNLPRMADFSECAEMVSRILGHEEGAFLKAYHNNINLQIEEIIESSQIATCLAHWFDEFWPKRTVDLTEEKSGEWNGTATELLQILEDTADILKINIKSRLWPKSPGTLSRRLNEIAVTLKEIGISIEFVRRDRGKRRTITISRMPSSSSSSSSNKDQTRNDSKNDDDTDDDKKASSQMPSSNIDENHSQLQSDDGVDGDDDILHTINNEKRSIWICPKCNESMDLFWKKHHQCV